MKISNVANWAITIITALAAAYGIISAEYGSLFRGPEFEISMSDSIDLHEHYGNLNISTEMFIRNTGKKVGTITNISAFLKKKNVIEKELIGKAYNPHSFLTTKSMMLGTFTIDANEIWSATVVFAAERTEKESRIAREFILETVRDLNAQYRSNSEFKGAYFIDDSLYKKIVAFVSDKIKNFDIGEYQVLFMIWDDSESPHPIWKKGYSFRLSDSHIEAFKVDSLEDYRSMQTFNPKYIPLVLTLELEEIKDEREIDILYTSFLNNK